MTKQEKNILLTSQLINDFLNNHCIKLEKLIELLDFTDENLLREFLASEEICPIEIEDMIFYRLHDVEIFINRLAIIEGLDCYFKFKD